ncbi:hypothetical protein SEHO0A_pSEHO0A1p05705 (plasmid) [Salmonella enterica subsp. houtenae str. ATCC BAA-1581]|nr:hypothetical protein SEHO0A_pSEHO0A1p05705 [Salmonella enterica subsp. houtenae str. ATCC BAA-1581]
MQLQARARRRVQRGELLDRVGGELLLIERGRLDEVAVGA